MPPLFLLLAAPTSCLYLLGVVRHVGGALQRQRPLQAHEGAGVRVRLRARRPRVYGAGAPTRGSSGGSRSGGPCLPEILLVNFEAKHPGIFSPPRGVAFVYFESSCAYLFLRPARSALPPFSTGGNFEGARVRGCGARQVTENRQWLPGRVWVYSCRIRVYFRRSRSRWYFASSVAAPRKQRYTLNNGAFF